MISRRHRTVRADQLEPGHVIMAPAKWAGARPTGFRAPSKVLRTYVVEPGDARFPQYAGRTAVEYLVLDSERPPERHTTVRRPDERLALVSPEQRAEILRETAWKPLPGEH